jgi:hypothetical protein
MNISSLPIAPSSISPASGSHCGDVYETRSKKIIVISELVVFRFDERFLGRVEQLAILVIKERSAERH